MVYIYYYFLKYIYFERLFFFFNTNGFVNLMVVSIYVISWNHLQVVHLPKSLNTGSESNIFRSGYE